MPTKRATKKTVRRSSKAKTSTRHSKHQKINFEQLEVRQMMSTVNVANFGAVANDGHDDTAAIQAAINSSSNGDTILFSGGTFNIGDTFILASNRTYVGQNGATLAGRGSYGEMLKIQGNNVTVKNLTLNGGGIFLESSGGGYNQNIDIDSVRFNLNTFGTNPNGITFTSGLQDSTINNCYFTGYTGVFSIYGYNYNNLKITNNSLVNTTSGMHIDAFGNSGNLLVQGNYIVGDKGMGMEFQGQASNLKFLDNVYEHPNLSTTFNQNNNSFAYSLILDKSSNIDIERNTCIAPERPDGVGCRIGFEVGGDNTLVKDNYVNGVNQVVACNDGEGSCSVTLQNNNFSNFLEAPGGIRSSSMLRLGTNDASTTLTWNINRPLPGAGTNVGGTGTTTSGGGSDDSGGTSGSGGSGDSGGSGNSGGGTTTDSTVPSAATGLSAVATGTSTANLFWTDTSYNETGFKIYSSTDGTTWNLEGTVAANATSFTDTGLTSGTKYSFTVLAFNANGTATRSNIDTATPAAPHLSGTYISDMTWTSSTNGWGDAERDRSNGEQGSSDGEQLAMNGVQYAKGVGVHAGSEINIALGGKYSTFLADIGIDDETGGQGSVVFQVWADGVKLYDSGTITANRSPKPVSVDVSGAQALKLVVSSATGDNDFDHADWGNARLRKTSSSGNSGGNSGGTTVVDPGTTYLSDLPWTKVSNGWGKVEANTSVGERAAGDGQTMTINGKTYASGLGVNSYSEIHYNLNGKYGNFVTDMGIDDEVGNRGSADFQIWADGVKLYDSGTMTGADDAQSVNVNVEGRNELVLIVNDAGDDSYFDHADWANARLTSAPRPLSVQSTYISDIKGTVTTGTARADSSLGSDADGDTFITLDGRTYAKGLGVSSGTKISYNLNGKYSTFITDLGIDDEVGNAGTVAFQIWADGTKLYDSGTVNGGSAVKTAEVNVSGAKQLWLVVSNAGDGKAGDHADWANARLIAA